MMRTAVTIAVAIALPFVVFVSGAYVTAQLSHRERIVEQLRVSAAESDRKPLSQRLGYDLPAVARYFGALDRSARDCERYFLELDLIFPFLYGGALAGSLLMVWSALGRPFTPAYLLAPVAITMIADWTENIVQLGQLRLFAEGGAGALNAQSIQLASAATILKLMFFAGSSVLLLFLVVIAAVRAMRIAL
jgi:hypothetical protein